MQRFTGRKKAHIKRQLSPPLPTFPNVRFCPTIPIPNTTTTKPIYLYPRQPYCKPLQRVPSLFQRLRRQKLACPIIHHFSAAREREALEVFRTPH